MFRNDSGFTAMTTVLGLVVLGLVVVAGYFVYSNSTSDQDSVQTSSNNETTDVSESDEGSQTSDESEMTTPDGWTVITNAELGLGYAVPDKWGSLQVNEYDYDETIAYGFGSPVSYVYRGNDFQSVMVGEDGSKVYDELVNLRQGYEMPDFADDMAVFVTGDGGCGRHVVALAYQQKVYDIRAPQFCLDGDLLESDVEADLAEFIDTIYLL